MKWKIENKKLVRDFEFADFQEALVFVNKIAKIAEELKHHPDILIHSYNKIRVMIYTHDEDKITDKDYGLAEEIDVLNKD